MRISLLFLCVPAIACARPDDRPIVPRAVATSSSSTAATSSQLVEDSASPPKAPDATPRRMPTETELLTWVHRVPPSGFPNLPNSVRTTLEERHCLVPQAGGSQSNAISGAFTAKGAVEWAVLCSVHDTSAILIMNAATGVVVDSLQKSGDAHWIQGDVGNTWLFSRMIVLIPMGELNTAPADTSGESGVDYAAFLPKPIDHDGIGQWFLEKAGVTLYNAGGRWIRVSTGD